MEGDSLVFKGFPLNRVQQRLRRRSLILLSPRARVHFLLTFQLVFMKTWMSLLYFFALFPNFRKSAASAAPPESEGARQCHLIHAGSSAASLGLGHGPCKWRALLLGPPHGGDTLEDVMMVTCPAIGSGPMAAMSVLGTRRFSRRLTTCDVVWVRPGNHAAASVSSWGLVTPVVVQRQVPGHGLWLSQGTPSCAIPRRLLAEFLILGLLDEK